MSKPHRVVVLLSGGLDSMVSLAMLVAAPPDEVAEVHALIFDYGQSCKVEIPKAVQLCKAWQVPFTVRSLSLEERDAHKEIPARNLIFLAHALGLAWSMKFNAVAIGADPDDIYPDSSTKFLNQMSAVFLTLGGFELLAPVKNYLNKSAVVFEALELGVPLHLCHSSYSDQVDGQCRPSRAFLHGLQSLLPEEVAARDVLRAAEEMHTGERPAFNPRFLFAGGSPNDRLAQLGIKQAASMMPRPRYHPRIPRSTYNEEQVQALRSLGYDIYEQPSN